MKHRRSSFFDPKIIMPFWHACELGEPDISTERLIFMCCEFVMEETDIDYLDAHDMVMKELEKDAKPLKTSAPGYKLPDDFYK